MGLTSGTYVVVAQFSRELTVTKYQFSQRE